MPSFVSYFRMYGLFQTTFYFGYMALFSIALGILCGKYYLILPWLTALLSTLLLCVANLEFTIGFLQEYI